MANITIFPETTRSDFGLDDKFGYCIPVSQNVTALEIGKVYIVVWDGTSYTCCGIDASEVMPNTVAIGNLAGFGGYGQGEPFAIAYTTYFGGPGYIVSALADSSTTHTFAIYEKEQSEPEPEPDPDPEPEPDIVLKDFNGEDMTFSDVEKVALNNTEGDAVIFSKGEALENVDIELNFANGNQVVEAPSGCFVKKATITKPDNLVPEHIAEGINIAGIIGTLVGGANVKIASGQFSGNNGTVEVKHNLETTPDFIMAWVNGYSSVSSLNSSKAAVFWGMSKGFKDAVGLQYVSIGVLPSSSSAIKYDGSSSTFGSIARLFPYVNETVFRVGSEYVQTASGKTYNWFALGGLT